MPDVGSSRRMNLLEPSGFAGRDGWEGVRFVQKRDRSKRRGERVGGREIFGGAYTLTK